MTKVKICGLSRPEDIEAVNAYGADYAGFVFFEKSKRNVGYEKAEKLKKNPNIQSVAVCVSPSKEEVKRLNDMGFDLIQIHGTIPADCQSDGGLALWQAVNIAGSSDVNFLFYRYILKKPLILQHLLLLIPFLTFLQSYINSPHQ